MKLLLVVLAVLMGWHLVLFRRHETIVLEYAIAARLPTASISRVGKENPLNPTGPLKSQIYGWPAVMLSACL